VIRTRPVETVDFKSIASASLSPVDISPNNLPKVLNERTDKGRLRATECLPWDEAATDWNKCWSGCTCLADNERCSGYERKHFTSVEEGLAKGKQNVTQ
jgi:hypothetical protein